MNLKFLSLKSKIEKYKKMKLETIADIGDIIKIKVDKNRIELAKIIRIDIFSMDRGCYACEYTTDLLKCIKDGDNVKETNVILAEHEIKQIGNNLYSKL